MFSCTKVTCVFFQYSPCLTGWEVDLSPINSFRTIPLTALFPTIYRWSSCDYWKHYFMMQSVTPFSNLSKWCFSFTWQRDCFKHENVRIRSSEKKNSDKLLTCWHNTSHAVYRLINSTCHRERLFFSLFSCKTSSKASAIKMLIKLNTKTRLWIAAHRGVHTWISFTPSPHSHLQL